jgi:hypothetical protein
MIDKNIQFVIKRPICDGIGNVLKSFITAFSANDNTCIDCNPEYALGVYNTVLDSRHIFNNDPQMTHEFMYTSRLLVLVEEENDQSHIPLNENYEVNGCGNLRYNYLYSFRALIDYNYDPALLATVLKERIWKCIDNIAFTPEMYQWMNDMISVLNIDNKTLGISIRTWKAFHEHNINRPYDSSVYKEQIMSVLASRDVTRIIVSYDNPEEEKEYTAFFSMCENKYNLTSVYTIEKSPTMNHLQYAVIKMLLLSKCGYFIGNRISTFSELVFWWSKCNIECFMVY